MHLGTLFVRYFCGVLKLFCDYFCPCLMGQGAGVGPGPWASSWVDIPSSWLDAIPYVRGSPCSRTLAGPTIFARPKYNYRAKSSRQLHLFFSDIWLQFCLPVPLRFAFGFTFRPFRVSPPDLSLCTYVRNLLQQIGLQKVDSHRHIVRRNVPQICWCYARGSCGGCGVVSPGLGGPVGLV